MSAVIVPGQRRRFQGAVVQVVQLFEYQGHPDVRVRAIAPATGELDAPATRVRRWPLVPILAQVSAVEAD